MAEALRPQQVLRYPLSLRPSEMTARPRSQRYVLTGRSEESCRQVCLLPAPRTPPAATRTWTQSALFTDLCAFCVIHFSAFGMAGAFDEPFDAALRFQMGPLLSHDACTCPHPRWMGCGVGLGLEGQGFSLFQMSQNPGLTGARRYARDRLLHVSDSSVPGILGPDPPFASHFEAPVCSLWPC